MKKTVLPILLATVWISLSEFARNEFLVKDHWTRHYGHMGLDFPDAPMNGAVWGLWSLAFAVLLFLLARRASLWETTLVGWWAGFLMMWLVAGNLGVLPPEILPVAVPLSLLEAFVAAWIIHRLRA